MRFIQKRVHQKRKRFIKHRNVQAHRGKKDVERVHQNDLRKTEAKDPQKVHLVKRWKTAKKKKEKKEKKARQAENPKGQSRQKLGPKKKKKRKKKKRKPARLKTQKGGLGKSQGQRKKKEKKPARLKTQKGGLGKSQGQRKEEEEEEKKNQKILPSWEFEHAT